MKRIKIIRMVVIIALFWGALKLGMLDKPMWKLIDYLTGNTSVEVKQGYRNTIAYHCADWGPNEDGTDDLIYFVKQIMFSAGEKYLGNDVYLCSMKPDGTEKKEIVKLFENTEDAIGMGSDSANMDICYQTRTAAISLPMGSIANTGLWTVNLDGTDFKRIVEQSRGDGERVRVDHPSWFPDGEHLVYQEKQVKTGEFIEYYIVKIDKNGNNKEYLTSEEDGGKYNMQPAISPDGKTIAYSYHWRITDPRAYKTGGRNLHLMNSDGSNKRILYDNIAHYADYPEWSPDGEQIYVLFGRITIVDAVTGKQLLYDDLKFDGKKMASTGKVHWSKYGYLVDGGLSIKLIKLDRTGYILLSTDENWFITENKRDLSKFDYHWGGKQNETIK